MARPRARHRGHQGRFRRLRQGLRRVAEGNVAACQRAHALCDRVDDQGDDVRVDRHARRRGQARARRSRHEVHPRASVVRSMGHARAHDPRPSHASQRPAGHRFVLGVELEVQSGGYHPGASLHPTHGVVPLGVAVSQRPVRPQRPDHRARLGHALGAIRQEAHLRAVRHERDRAAGLDDHGQA